MIRTFIEAQGPYKFLQKLFGNTQRTAYRYTENILDKYEHLLEYKYIHNSSKRLNQIHTEEPIILMEDLSLGSTIREVRKQFSGKPFVKMYRSNGLTRTILLYKIKMGGQKVKVEAHFYKNEMFFSHFTFSEPKNKDQSNLLQHFAAKYKVADLDFVQKNIVGQNNHSAKIITIDKGVTISYIDLENRFFDKMQVETALATADIELIYATNLSVQ